MKKNMTKSEMSQVTALDNRIIEIANNCANKIWDGSWNYNFKVIHERNLLIIKVSDGSRGMYSLEIEGGSVVFIQLHNKMKGLGLTDLWFINEIDGCADEITEISDEVA